MVLLVATGGCFRGAEREKQAPPGLPGGLCLAPDGRCEAGAVCNQMQNYCYDPFDPCEGVFCGGSDRGICEVDGNGLPRCLCAPGFENETYALYCCPVNPLLDPSCAVMAGDDDGAWDGESADPEAAGGSSDG